MSNLDSDPFKTLERQMPTNPELERTFQDIRDLNTMLELEEVEFDFDKLKPLLDEFNKDWPYFQREIPVTAKELCYYEEYFDDEGLDEDDDDEVFVDVVEVEVGIYGAEGIVVSHGFGFRGMEEDQPRLGHIFAFDIIDDKVIAPTDPEDPEFFGWADIDDVAVHAPNIQDEDPEEYLRFYLPGFMEEIDTKILNANDVVGAVESLRGLTFKHERIKNVREQRGAMEGYLNKNIRFIQQIPYTLLCKGLVHIVDNDGNIGTGIMEYPEKRKAWAVIEKITMIAPLANSTKHPRFLDQVSIPAIVAKVYEPELSELETDQYVRTVIPITDDLRIISNTDRLL